MPRVIRNFRLLEEIGTGGMGVIWRAVQMTLDRQVAVKELHPHLARDAEFIRRFEREAKAAASLSHENIVAVIDYGAEADSYFIALEFVDGRDLRMLMKEDPKIVLPVAIAVTISILRGLEHAHEKGVVHRDVKPANVMLTRDGRVKLADFSAAMASSQSVITVTGSTIGTPAYMSPEQASGEGPMDRRTDLFSAGVILWEMLAGRRPFEGESHGTVITRLLTHHPPSLCDVDARIPASIGRIAARALEKNPDDRYKSASEFARDLEQAAIDEKIPWARSLVSDYVRDPKGFQDSLRRRQATELVERGLYMLNQGGQSELALKAFQDALTLDSGNAEARSRITQLESSGARTVKRAPLALARRPARSPALWSAIGIVLVIALVAGWFGSKRGNEIGVPGLASSSTAAAAPSISPDWGLPVSSGSAGLASDYVLDPELLPSPGSSSDARPGLLRVHVKPWADVFVDGEQVGTTPMAEPIPLTPGRHLLVLRNERCIEFSELVELVEDGVLKRDVTLTCR